MLGGNCAATRGGTMDIEEGLADGVGGCVGVTSDSGL